MQIRLEPVAVGGARFQSILARHRAFWERAAENSYLHSVGVFAPSVPVRLPQADGTEIERAQRLTPDMVDPTAMLDEVERHDPEATDLTRIAQRQSIASFGVGDLVPFSQPFFKIPWLEAMLGCPIKMTEGQIWVVRHKDGPEAVIRRGVRFEHDPWFQLYLEFLRQLQDRIGAHYPVSANTLLRGPSDLVAAVTGVREACMGWIDQPEMMARLMRVCTDANLVVIEGAQHILRGSANGHMSGWGIWAPGPVVRMQADHSTLLSPDMYEKQILPFDLEVIRSCPCCIFHIHNNGFHIAHLLVEVPELDVLQVVVDPYPSGERKAYEVRMMQMVQEYKPLILDVNLPTFDEAQWLLDQLSTQGLCFNARFAPEVLAAMGEDVPGSEMWVLDSPSPGAS